MLHVTYIHHYYYQERKKKKKKGIPNIGLTWLVPTLGNPSTLPQVVITENKDLIIIIIILKKIRQSFIHVYSVCIFEKSVGWHAQQTLYPNPKNTLIYLL